MDTVGRRCPCNGLITNIGLPQPRADREELPLLTSGFDVASITALIGPGGSNTTAAVIEHLLAGVSQGRQRRPGIQRISLSKCGIARA